MTERMFPKNLSLDYGIDRLVQILAMTSLNHKKQF